MTLQHYELDDSSGYRSDDPNYFHSECIKEVASSQPVWTGIYVHMGTYDWLLFSKQKL